MTRTLSLATAAFLLTLVACGGNGGDSEDTSGSAQGVGEDGSASVETFDFGEEIATQDGLTLIVGKPEEWTLEEAFADQDGMCYVDPSGETTYDERPCEWSDYAATNAVLEGVDPTLPHRIKVPMTLRNDTGEPLTDVVFDDTSMYDDGEFAINDGGQAVEPDTLLPGDTEEGYAYFFLSKFDPESVLLDVGFWGMSGDEQFFVTNDPALLKGS